METRTKIFFALSTLYETHSIPNSWLWKWLVPLPKCHNPQLTDLRPLVLIEALRKAWVGIFTFRINIFLHKNNILSNNQHGFIWGRSVESASLILLNALETAKEWRSSLFISSWDIKRAFDSVPFRMLIWSLVRIGVPLSLAQYLVSMDIEGKLVVRTPLSLAIHRDKGIQGLIDADMVFNAEKGTGQGDKLSPLIWDAFCDILLSALDEHKGGEFFTQDHLGVNRKTPDIAYADDIISLQGTMESLQDKADIISAFAILLNMELAIPKLRAFAIEWGNPHRVYNKSLTVHSFGWTPIEVDVKSDGDLKHLGITWSMDLTNLSCFQHAQNIIKTWGNIVRKSRLSPASKIIALETSIYAKITYIAKFSPWTAEQLVLLDKKIEVLLRCIFRCSYGTPAKLFYIAKQNGGFGCKQLSNEINKARLAMTLRLLAGPDYIKHAIHSCIQRGFRQAGQNSIEPVKSKLETPLEEGWWITNVQNYLLSLNLSLFRNGPSLPESSASWAGLHLNQDQRCILNRSNIYSYGECGISNNNSPLIIDGLNITNINKFTDISAIPLRPGQCWFVDNILLEILGFRNDFIEIIIWHNEIPISCNQEVYILDQEHSCGSGGGKLIPKDSLLLANNLALVTLGIEKHLSNGSTSSTILAIWPQLVRPQWTPPPSTNGFTDILSKIPSYHYNVYTDGSWDCSGSVADHILGSLTIKSNGAIVLDSGTEDSPEYFGIKIIGSLPHIKSAYTMELLSLLGGTHLLNISGCKGLIKSDCKAAINTCKSSWRSRPICKRYPWLLLIIQSLPKRPIYHVKSHPERNKRGTSWNSDDCGIFTADHVAGNGATCTKAELTDVDLLIELSRNVPFLILESDGGFCLEDIQCRYHRLLTADYLRRRDEYRAADINNPRPPKWLGMNTSFMASLLNIKQLKLNNIAKVVKAAFDWFYTGSNRIKGDLLASSSCPLCQHKLEDQKHILMKCNHPHQKSLRSKLLMDLTDTIVLEAIPSINKALRIILHIIQTDESGYQLLLGLPDPALRECIRDKLNFNITNTHWNLLSCHLRSMGLQALNIILSHVKLSTFIISGKRPSGHLFLSSFFKDTKESPIHEPYPSTTICSTPDSSPSLPPMDVSEAIEQHCSKLDKDVEFDTVKVAKRHRKASTTIYDDLDLSTNLCYGKCPGKTIKKIYNLPVNNRFMNSIKDVSAYHSPIDKNAIS